MKSFLIFFILATISAVASATRQAPVIPLVTQTEGFSYTFSTTETVFSRENALASELASSVLDGNPLNPRVRVQVSLGLQSSPATFASFIANRTHGQQVLRDISGEVLSCIIIPFGSVENTWYRDNCVFDDNDDYAFLKLRRNANKNVEINVDSYICSGAAIGGSPSFVQGFNRKTGEFVYQLIPGAGPLGTRLFEYYSFNATSLSDFPANSFDFLNIPCVVL